MPILTVKIDDALKNDASAVLDELGLDIPTAVRMYLKAIIRENGLPINTTLKAAVPAAPAAAPAPCCCADEAPCCCAEAEPAEEAIPAPAVEEAPAAAAAKTKEETVADFVALICSVPAGSLTRWSDMEACLTERAGEEIVRPVRVTWPETTAAGDPIPYWRIVTERGAVRGDALCEKEIQEEKLKEEGNAFVPAGHGIFSGIKVENYKNKLVKF